MNAAEKLVRERLGSHFRDVVGIPDWESATEKRIGPGGGREPLFSRFKHHVDPRGKRFLDVGSGYGEMLELAWRDGAQVFGLEPDIGTLQAASAWMRSRGIIAELVGGIGESLPFDSESFDVVNSMMVLEHVSDLKCVISEMARVLKPGGVLYLNAPNHLFPYEGHYRLPWIPYMPKAICQIYLRLVGRDPTYFIHSVFYVNPFAVSRYLRRAGLSLQVDLMAELWRSPDIVASSNARNVLRIIRRFPMPDAIRLLFMPDISVIYTKASVPTTTCGRGRP